ncbi:endonuclease [Diplodia corticola]|uniref:Endonuclease n=1 Tax=Diplodia corticola TaxID=236234 RepID=A0A1J9S728_9PEZI|nr:endonuclease [Diplodia corticola]OJD35724.1 endonuclease [Diplodia corticola]
MPATRAQVRGGQPDDDARSPTWCLAELENSGAMHPDSYKHVAPAPKGDMDESNNPRKRKDSKQHSSPSPTKATRNSNRASSAEAEKGQQDDDEDDATKPPQDQVKLLRFLLSPHALPYTTPEAEASQPSSVRTYATARLTPFEELLAAVILSRPISHALGQRAVRTVLNPPYGLTTPGKVRTAAGEGKVQEALGKARTQHKEKTAEEIGGLAEAVVERWGDGEDGDGGLEGVRVEAGWDVGEERRVLKEAVKGLGETGLDIFCRRVQWLWQEVYPFVDGRTKGALEQLGLPGEASGLRKLMENGWDEIGVKDIGLKDEEEKKRRAFVLVLERAVGASLEKRVQDVVTEAAKE